MMKEVVRALESGALPEIGLIAFLVAFVLIVVRVMTMKKREREEAKQIPLEDDIVTPFEDGADDAPKHEHNHA